MPAPATGRPAPQRLSLHRARPVRPLPLPLLPPAHAAPARRRRAGLAAASARPLAASSRVARHRAPHRRPRSTRASAARSPTAARGARLRPPRARRPRDVVVAARPPSRAPSYADEDVEDIRGLVEAFGASPLCARSPPRASVRREAGFAFRLDPAGGALVNGFVDVLAREADGDVLIVDYKSDRLERSRARRRRRGATTRPSGSSTRSPRCATARPPSRSPTASSSAPRSPVGARFSPRDVPALAERLTRSPRACSRAATPSPPSRTAASAATARAARRCARGRRR